jgi:hypothetical protein
MSRDDHPSVYEACCKTYSRGPTPAGHMVRYHSKWCKESPNQEIPRRAEVASWAAKHYAAGLRATHDYDTCMVKDCEACAYILYWQDRDDDLGDGG